MSTNTFHLNFTSSSTQSTVQRQQHHGPPHRRTGKDGQHEGSAIQHSMSSIDYAIPSGCWDHDDRRGRSYPTEVDAAYTLCSTNRADRNADAVLWLYINQENPTHRRIARRQKSAGHGEHHQAKIVSRIRPQCRADPNSSLSVNDSCRRPQTSPRSQLCR